MNTSGNIYAEELKNAIASVEIEGYNVSASQKEACLEFVSGKISKEEFIKMVLERC